MRRPGHARRTGRAFELQPAARSTVAAATDLRRGRRIQRGTGALLRGLDAACEHPVHRRPVRERNRRRDVGRRKSRMRTDADRTQIVATETPLPFEHEHDVGELALAVAAPRRITPPPDFRVLKIYATDTGGEAADMHAGAYRGDPGDSRPLP